MQNKTKQKAKKTPVHKSNLKKLIERNENVKDKVIKKNEKIAVCKLKRIENNARNSTF